MANFGPKIWVNPFGKMYIFNFLNFFFLLPKKGFFRSKISKKTFSYTILPKKKVGHIAILGPKPWVNSFEKMSVFRPFKLLVFIP